MNILVFWLVGEEDVQHDAVMAKDVGENISRLKYPSQGSHMIRDLTEKLYC